MNKLKQVLSNPYLRNVGWMGSAELANRLVRLSTTVILARIFSPQDYGLMAVIFMVADFANVFMLKGGIGAKIIQVDRKDLEPICNTAYWLNWIICSSLFVIQCAVALLLLPYFSADSNLTLPLCFTGLVYLMHPLSAISLVLIERENRFKIIAIFNVIHSSISNILTAIFALMGFGIWAIVWSMLSASFVWAALVWRFHPWRPPLKFGLHQWKEVLGFGSNLIAYEMLNRVKTNVDYLIVGRYLGVEALGMYYFAFNAGSGITLNLLYHFMSPLYPYICEVRSDYIQFKSRYFSSLRKVSLVLVPLILAQSSLAFIYVPIVFGEKWISAIPVLVLICLSNIPKIYDWAASFLLNAIDKTHISLFINIVSTATFILSILAVVRGGIVWVALVVFLNSFIISSGSAVAVNRFALREKFFGVLDEKAS